MNFTTKLATSQLTDKQISVLKEYYEREFNKKNVVVFDLPMGTGKTFLSLF